MLVLCKIPPSPPSYLTSSTAPRSSSTCPLPRAPPPSAWFPHSSSHSPSSRAGSSELSPSTFVFLSVSFGALLSLELPVLGALLLIFELHARAALLLLLELVAVVSSSMRPVSSACPFCGCPFFGSSTSFVFFASQLLGPDIPSHLFVPPPPTPPQCIAVRPPIFCDRPPCAPVDRNRTRPSLHA